MKGKTMEKTHVVAVCLAMVLRDDTADCGRFFPHFTPNLRPGYKPPAKD